MTDLSKPPEPETKPHWLRALDAHYRLCEAHLQVRLARGDKVKLQEARAIEERERLAYIAIQSEPDPRAEALRAFLLNSRG